MTVLLEPAVHEWYCPQCGATDQTREVRPHSRFHPCPKLRGLTFPMLPAGTKAKVEAREREDYVGNDIPQTDENGRPVMSVITTRDDGQDAVIFAPTAIGRGS
jgi:hypothetical protein